MDVSQYVGKFIVKNNFCSIPGLGVIEVKKTTSTYNASTNEMSSPVHYITFNPIGTIDDSFASFIANRENVSIANASNAISNFAKGVKLEATRRGKYELDYIGDFFYENNKLTFKQSNDFDLGHSAFQYKPLSSDQLSEPANSVTSTISKEYAGDSYAAVSSAGGKFNWSSALFLIILSGLLAAGAFMGYNYWQNNKSIEVHNEKENNSIPAIKDTSTLNEITPLDTSSQAATIPTADTTSISTNTPATSTPVAAAPVAAGNSYKVAILTYSDQASADKKAARLKSFGNNAEVVNSNGSFVVAINSTPIADTAHLVDSLRMFFNPKGPVYIIK
jgi:hypothetical protein